MKKEREISDEDLEAMLELAPSVREAKVADHELMVKALEHPVRRKMIKGNYLKIEGDTFRLTDRGLVLLSNVRK